MAVTFTYPTDLIRRKFQLQGMPGYDKVHYTGMIHCAKELVKADGVSGLFKGLVPCYVKIIPSTAIMFMCNEWLKRLLAVE